MDSWDYYNLTSRETVLPYPFSTPDIPPDSVSPHKNALQISNILGGFLRTQDLASPGQRLERAIQKNGGGLQKGFYSLTREEQIEIRDSLGKETLGRLFALAGEDHAEFFYASLLGLGQKLEGKNPLLSQSLYTALIQEPNAAQFADQARNRLKVLQGQGNLGDQAEVLTAHFMDQFLDPALWVGMGVGIGLFRSVSAKVLNAFARPSFTAKAAAYTVGFAAEVPGFTLASRGVQHLQGVEMNPLGTDLALNGLGLFFLKAGGAAGYASLGRIRNAGFLSPTTRTILTKTAPAVAMYGGINLGHGAQVAFGLRDFHSWGALFMESAATLAHFGLISKTMQAWIPTKTPVGLPEHRGGSGASRLTELFQAAENRLTQALQNTIKGYEVRVLNTPEGLKFPFIVRMEGSGSHRSSKPPADRPHPKPASGEGPRRPVKNGEVDQGIQERLGKLETELREYGDLPFADYGWTGKARDWAQLLKVELQNIAKEMHRYNPEDPSLEVFAEMNRELTRIGALLDYLVVRQELEPFAVPNKADVMPSSFLRNFGHHAFPLVEFLQGHRGPEPTLQVIQRARYSLMGAAKEAGGMTPEQVVESRGPTSDLGPLLTHEAYRISGALLKLSMEINSINHPNLWLYPSLKSFQEFENLYRLTRRDIELDPSKGDIVARMEIPELQIKEIMRLLNELNIDPRLAYAVNGPQLVKLLYQATNPFLHFVQGNWMEETIAGSQKVLGAALHEIEFPKSK